MKKRDRVRLKFNGLCAYTGKPLDDKWQIDHIEPDCHFVWGRVTGDKNHIDNLMPAIRIINHYKGSHNLEGFRRYMLSFHLRLKKLPKNTVVQRTKDRIIYLKKVAELFGITVEKPFDGKFYFETIQR